MSALEAWRKKLKFDPLPALLGAGDEALSYFAKRDLLGGAGGSVRSFREMPEARKILRKQRPDGSWDRAAGAKKHADVNYGLIETWKNFRILIEKFGFDREDPAAGKAAEFLFSCQTEEGDIRGFLANQYATYYTGAVLSLLIKAGYGGDPRVEKAFRWLLSMRQDDLGWTVPIITHDFDGKTMHRLTSRHAAPVEPDRSKPFSHNWTGMVLRAFAAHGKYRRSEAAVTAAKLMKTRFFQADSYSSYRSASYWVKFQYPFWWNNLVAALDSISLIDPSMDGPMEEAAGWLVDHQQKDGLWKASYAGGAAENSKTRETSLWVSLATCRLLRRLFGSPI